MEHGERLPPHLCAGCRRPIGEAAALDLIDGNRVHDSDGYACLIPYGERWRSTASRALLAMHLPPPAHDGGTVP
jgi:hypothetical protein